MNGNAYISSCKKYRYNLWRSWDPAKGLLGFCMLNPSTADDIEGDPTIDRCCERARLLGFGGIIVVNAFAYRSTDPKELKKVIDPVGEANDQYIWTAAKISQMLICGWGKHASLNNRNVEVLKIIKDAGVTPMALKINMDGSPSHPLYIGYKVLPKIYDKL